MRESLTIFAIAIILVLFAALVGPYFYDWTQARALIETRLSRAVGTPIKISGDIDVKLLPTPYLIASGVSNAPANPGEAKFQAKSMRFELAAMPLLGGDLQFTDASFYAPEFTFFVDEDNFSWPKLPKSTPASVRFDKISVFNGALHLVDIKSGTTQSLFGITGTASATSLQKGPYKADGTLNFAQTKVPFHLSTAALEPETVRIKLSVDETEATPKTMLDGALRLENTLKFEGQFTAQNSLHLSMGDLPWSVSGPISITRNQAVSEALETKIGPEERPLKFTGSAQADLLNPDLRLRLKAGTFDFDALFAPKSAQAMPLDLALRARMLYGELQSLPRDWPLSVDVKVDSVVLGGEPISNAHLSIEDKNDAVPSLHLEAGGPFGSHIKLDGTLFEQSNFIGSIDASTKNAAALLQWLSLAPKEQNLLFRSFALQGPVALNNGLSSPDAKLTLDRSVLHGALSFTPAALPAGAHSKAKITANLASDALDLDSIPDLSALTPLAADAELHLNLDATTVKFAKVGQGQLEAGHITLDLARANETLNINRLKFENIGGANLEITGSVSPSATILTARADAQKLDEMTKLLARLFPGTVTQTLKSRAALLEPLHLEVSAQSAGDFTDMRNVQKLDVSGISGGSQISLSHKSDGTGFNLSGKIHADDITRLFAQTGVPTLPLIGLGKADVGVTAQGKWGAPVPARITATLAGTDLNFAPVLNPDLTTLSGAYSLKSSDASALLQALSVLLPDIQSRLPLNLLGDASLAFDSSKITLQGEAAGTKLSGGLSVQTDASPVLKGNLALNQLDVQSLFSLLLGPQQTPKRGELWSDAKFLAGAAQLPDLALALTAEKLTLSPTQTAGNASFKLDLSGDRLALSQANMAYNGGNLGGTLTLRRAASNVSLSGEASFNGLDLSSLLLSGKADGKISFAASGPSAAQLVGSAGGSGTLTISEGLWRGQGIPALYSVVAATERDEIKADVTALQFALTKELDKYTRSIDAEPAPLALANGAIKIGPGNLLPGLAAFMLGYDVRTGVFSANTSLTSAPPKNWNGPAPAIELAWRGPFAAPTRIIEVNALANALASRAIERNQAKIDALDADIRERALFVRRMKAFKDLELRQKQEEDARKKAEEDTKREELKKIDALKAEALKKADEATRRKTEGIKPATPLVQELPLVPEPPLQLEPPVAPQDAPLQLTP